MMKYIGVIQLSILVLLLSCSNGSVSKKSKSEEAKNEAIKTAHDSISKDSLKVSAHLIYNDETLSSFDVLNNKTIALWNVVAGGGDAVKPSEKTRINFAGNLDSLNIKIKNGRKSVIDTIIIHSKNASYIIKNTGCQEIYLNVLKNNKSIYSDTIPFHCGE